ncbi:MAG: hypothetical protein MI920_30715 [Kiloniellales bacterium]|nr:hypothetical protein [Kiloniellales bacterium]
MADAALTHPRLIDDDLALDRSAVASDRKWSKRKSLLFIVGTSTALWCGIILGVWAAF